MTTWILVSDVSRAKLFSAERRDEVLSLVKEFEHPEGHKFSRDIRPSGPPGHMQQSHGPGGRRSSMEPHKWPKEAEAERFAEQLGHYLEEAIGKHQFDALVLVAPPHFLGILHGTLGRQTAKHLQATVDKDLSMLDAAELRQRLVDVAFPPESTARNP
jgi:protein required for attachment to host cells